MPVQRHSDKLVLNHPSGASAEILFYGATVVSWKSGSQGGSDVAERLFVSSKAALDGSKPVRGGIPVVFPCFGAPVHPEHTNLAQHGFARNEVWMYDSIVLDNEAGVSVRLSEVISPLSRNIDSHRSALEPTDSIKQRFSKSFHLAYVVTLAEHQISTDLHVKNTATSESLEFQALLHSYLRVPANKVLIKPLKGLSYFDKTEASEDLRAIPKVEEREAVDVKSFTDSVYENAPGKYELSWDRNLVEIRAHGFPNVVVWNPQKEAGEKIGDMENGGWEKYVCVEPGYVRGFVNLKAGETWLGQQVITIVQ